MRRFGLSVALCVFMLPAAANAVVLGGGNTRLLPSAVTSGLTVGLIGTASIAAIPAGLSVNFPITGGMLDPVTLAGTIRHDGSGLSFTNGVNTLGLSNFVIDTTASVLFGTVTLNGALVGNDIGLFTFDLSTITLAELGDLTNPLLELTLTAVAADALGSAFGIDDFDDGVIGTAATSPSAVVPEPASWALLLAGFALTGTAMRRRTRTVAA
jgi:hypothetical protein